MFEDPRNSATSSSFGELYQKKECILIANRINENSEEPFQKNGKKKKRERKEKKTIRDQGTLLKLCFRTLWSGGTAGNLDAGCLIPFLHHYHCTNNL